MRSVNEVFTVDMFWIHFLTTTCECIRHEPALAIVQKVTISEVLPCYLTWIPLSWDS